MIYCSWCVFKFGFNKEPLFEFQCKNHTFLLIISSCINVHSYFFFFKLILEVQIGCLIFGFKFKCCTILVININQCYLVQVHASYIKSSIMGHGCLIGKKALAHASQIYFLVENSTWWFQFWISINMKARPKHQNCKIQRQCHIQIK